MPLGKPWGGSWPNLPKGGEAYDVIPDVAHCDPSGIAHCGNSRSDAKQKKIAAPVVR